MAFQWLCIGRLGNDWDTGMYQCFHSICANTDLVFDDLCIFPILKEQRNAPPPAHGATAPRGPGPPHYRCFTVTLRHTTLGRTPLDEWSARCRDLYQTTHNTHKRQTSMPPAGFEPAIPASERPQTQALATAAIGIGSVWLQNFNCATTYILTYKSHSLEAKNVRHYIHRSKYTASCKGNCKWILTCAFTDYAKCIPQWQGRET
jgi:hypothetical protein